MALFWGGFLLHQTIGKKPWKLFKKKKNKNKIILLLALELDTFIHTITVKPCKYKFC